MELELNVGAIRMLEMLKKEAPKMELGKAYNYVKEYQEMRNDLEKYEFIIMMLLKVIGVNDSGWLSDKEIATKLKDMPDEIWNGLKLATRIQARYSCSPFTPNDWIDKAVKKFGTKKEDVDMYKNSQLSVVLPNGS